MFEKPDASESLLAAIDRRLLACFPALQEAFGRRGHVLTGIGYGALAPKGEVNA